MENISIQSTPPEERPYERCLMHGPESLTDAELLAIILRSGTRKRNVLQLASDLIDSHASYDGLGTLLHMSIEDYMSYEGLGKVKAIQLSCIGEICKRLWRHEINLTAKSFHNSAVIAGYYQQELRFMERECLKTAFLDNRNRFISDFTMTTGTCSSSPVSVREILIEALRHRAQAIILIHNHPLGTPDPSNDDIQVTDAVDQGCRAVGIRLLDHIIIGENSYYSFKEHSIL